MSERNFSRRRRGGMRFRPSRGLASGQRPDRSAQEARAKAAGGTTVEEPIFDRARHEREIQRAENLAAGLPPQGASAPAAPTPPATKDRDFRQPHLDVPAEVREEPSFTPVKVSEPPSKNLVDSIRSAATNVMQKVRHLIKPAQKLHKEIVVNVESLETRVAVLEDGRLEEFTIERSNEERLVGSIFKGKVKNLEDGLKAAFVDIGFEKNAFLHYWDIVPSNFDSGVELVERDTRKRDKPRITQRDIPRLYPPGSEIIVQVTKGPIGTKGPRVTTNLALPGRYLVLLPNSDQSGVSRKIERHEERQRLKQILRQLTIPEGMGVILRTAGEAQQARYFVRDLALLIEEWNQIQTRIDHQPPASCVFKEPVLIERTVRDFLTEDVERIVIDSEPEYQRTREMIGHISPRSVNKVKWYNESQPLFDRFNITRQLANAFARQVHLRSGGYLVIDETEALVAIDVNTGSHKSGKDQESTIVKVNLEAADEICRQLRLRNIGGLIVLDFIDMKSRRDQQAVFNRMRENLRRDRAKTHILPISQLGLMEMTRQRHSESVRSAVYDDCPYCKGRAKVKSAITMSVEIQRKLSEILKRRSRDESDFQLRIQVHPTILERLRNEDEKLLIELEKRYYGRLSFRADPAFHAEQFKIFNAVTNEELASTGG
jgi:ribonuclease G